jgi:predicted glutamine amidotransferase
MAFVSEETRDFPTVIGENFPEFVALSSFHKDGWGVAINNRERAQVLLARAPERADLSPTFSEKIRAMRGDGGLLHLRWATSGLDNCDENTHPFIYGPYSFIHNGDIKPRENLDKYIRTELNELRTGETDSERYFFLALSEMEKLGLVAGLQSAISIIDHECNYSSINSMLLTPEFLAIVTKYNDDRIPKGQPADYYQLRYQIKDKNFVIASSGWHQDNWTTLQNNSLLVIDRKNLDLNYFKI